MNWLTRWIHDCRSARCWETRQPWVLCKVVDTSGLLYTIPKLAMDHPGRASWIVVDPEKLPSGHWMEGMAKLPMTFAAAKYRLPATSEEVKKYVELTVEPWLLHRGWSK